MKPAFSILLLLISLVSCNSQEKTANNTETKKSIEKKEDSQIGQYVVKVLEDRNENLWFATIEKGVAKYDGNALKYIDSSNGLPGNFVSDIVEDKNGHLWFGTQFGLSKYDGKVFVTYTEKDGLCDLRIRDLLIDSKRNIWIGTWSGVCTFDGKNFKHFPIPYPEVKTQINTDTKDWITEIMEDSQGNIWFARDNYGVTKYNGKTFTHYLKTDGLYSNNVQVFEEDKQGNIWFGSRVAERDNPDPEKRVGNGGITKFDGKLFTHFPEIKGFNQDDIYEIYRDNSDHLWISTKSDGVYRFDGKVFKNYKVPISIMSMIKDKKGNLWLGGSGGLYMVNLKGKITNVTTHGPWK